MRYGEKLKRVGSTQENFDYKLWARRTANYPKVKIIDKMRVKARTAFLVFRKEYCVGDKKLELYDNVVLEKVSKAEWHVRICTIYLDYSL